MTKFYLFLGVLLLSFTSYSQVTLPLDFEAATTYTFNDFDGGGVTVISNPQSAGINTSLKVAKMIKNAGQTWGGSWISLNAPIDFSVNKIFKMKVFSPRVGAKVLLKVENQDNGAINYEREVLTTVANAWEELTFNYAAINVANQYQKVVFIFDNGTMGDGSANFTFLFDDLKLVPSSVPTLTQMNLPVTFDDATVDYGLIGFGGAEQSSIVTDPTLATNKVVKVIKTATAELWAGTTITAASQLGFSSRIPFTATDKKMNVRVWSPNAGIQVRLKVEEHGDPTHSVETEAAVTTAAGWQTLEFNFANNASGTAPINLAYNYDKASIFFNFGITGAVAGEKTYYFDDVQFGAAGGGGSTSTNPVLPLDFESSTITYTFNDFDGGGVTVISNPQSSGINTSSKVAKMVKSVGQTWGGSWILLDAPIDFSVNKTFKMKVFSPRVGAKVLLKVENQDNGAISYEKEVLTTVANAWEELTFNYAAINVANQYQKVVFIFDNGTMGDGSANFTFLFDDLKLVTSSVPTLTQMNLPVTFDVATVDYGLIGFGGAEQSTIVTDPTLVSNKVAKVIKTATAELWAGTTITAASQLGFSSRIPFTNANTKLSVRVWSPQAGIPVRLKVEDHSDASHSVETETSVTIANGWQTLEFDFANNATGTASINMSYNYDKASIFFNFGTTGAVAGEQTYYFDDLKFIPGGGIAAIPSLPLDFQSNSIAYNFSDFDGGNTVVLNNPQVSGINTSSKVARTIKYFGQTWGGSLIVLNEPIDFSVNKAIKMKVFSPRVGAKVLVKVENLTDGNLNFEKEVTTTQANNWEELTFDFSAISTTIQYQKMIFIFDNGTMGDGSANFTFLFDDVRQTIGSTQVSLTQMNLPVTFDLTTVEYGLIGFGGAEQSSMVTDPTLATNKVAKVIKSATAETWAGTTITAAAQLGCASRIPFTNANTKLSVRVWSPRAGIPVRLKVEDHSDATHSVETESMVTVASGWQTLEFDFANNATGTSAINLTYNYDKASIFFDFGTTGAFAGEQTYYFDDLKFVNDAFQNNNDELLSMISVYPNPTIGNIILSNPTSTPLNIRVFDANGKEVKRVTSNILKIDLNLRALAAGTYFLSIENRLNNYKVSKKIIKQ
jgi:hypothetical protein